MAAFSIPGVRIAGVSAAVPAQEIRNADMDLLAGDAGRAFVRAVGINSRRVAPPDLCASDLCFAAARELLARTGVPPGRIGALVFVTQTPDYPVPGNATLAQDRLGLPSSTFALDVNQGCAGYVYGLVALASLMRSASIANGLLLVGDTITRLLSPGDSSTLPLFSDAGSATLLTSSDEAATMHFNVGCEGKGADAIRVRGGGARLPFGRESLRPDEEDHDASRAPIHLAMRGIDVLHYTMQHVEPNIRELLAFAGADTSVPDYYVFHQANQLLNGSLLRRLGIGEDRAPGTLFDYGNTSCATIPVTICGRLGEALAGGPKTLLLSGFGAGFSWASALVRTDAIVCTPVLDVGGVAAV